MSTPRLEELRTALRSESISWNELAELQGLTDQIDPGDVELLEAAGVPEHALITVSGITLTDPADITAWKDGRLTIITVSGGVATVAEAPPRDRCLIIDYDECDQCGDNCPGFCADI